MKSNPVLSLLKLSFVIIFISACTNSSVNNNADDQAGDSLRTKAVTVKERQHFHTQAQRSLDSMQRRINGLDQFLKGTDNSNSTWNKSRDSLVHILDYTNKILNNQAYKSDADWNNFKEKVNSGIDSLSNRMKKDGITNGVLE